MVLPRRLPPVLIACAVVPCLVEATTPDDATRPAWKLAATAAIEETYDSNVMLQSVGEQADIESRVTALSAQFTVDWRAADMATVRLGYAPAWTQYQARVSEDFVAQRLTAAITGNGHGVAYALHGAAAFIDGSDEGVVWTGPGGAPATGGAAVRDRRDQAVYRASARLDWTAAGWLVRPVASVYLADFQTAERAIPGYLNNVDRDDLSAGLDLGRNLRSGLAGFLGYRRGRQDQARLLSYPEEFDNTYDRVLGSLEGRLAPWLTVALSAGPEFRRYGPHVHTRFPDRSVTNLFVDATATVALTGRDSLTLFARQFEQLSSAGRGAFEDLNIDLAWRHTFSSRASAGAALHAYNTDFLQPTVRDDWLLTARVHGSFAVNDAWTLDGSLTLERGDSRVPDTAGREYDRVLVALGARLKL